MANRRFAMLALLVVFAAATSASAQSLGEKIDSLLKDPALNHGLQGVMVKSLKTGQTLYEHNADNLMIPASNFKLLVSSTAIEKLGPDFTCKTGVYASGKIERGVLQGDLILRGGGDPVLETADITDLAKQVKSAGITQITGGLIADDSIFDSQRLGRGWSWEELPAYYAAEISGLTLNRNIIAVFVRPGATVGAPAEITQDPQTSYMTVENTATTGNAGSAKTIWVDRPMGVNVIKIGGTIALGTKVTKREAVVSVEEPALYAGTVFVSELAKQGVTITGGVKGGVNPADAKLVCSHTSPPLSAILRLLLKPSDNVVAEALLKDLGSSIKGKGSSAAGADVEKEFLTKAGLDMSELSITDGSGLSRLDYISPRNIVTLLSYMYTSPNSKLYIDCFPIAGVDGTLAYRMKGTSAEKNVHGKTGTVAHVSSLSGYVNTKSGEPLAFSILMNHQLCPKASATGIQDKICELLADLP